MQLDVVVVDDVPPDDVVVVVVVHPDELDEDVVVVDVVLVDVEVPLVPEVPEVPAMPEVPVGGVEDRQLLEEALSIVHVTSDPVPLALGISSQAADALSVPTFT